MAPMAASTRARTELEMFTTGTATPSGRNHAVVSAAAGAHLLAKRLRIP